MPEHYLARANNDIEHVLRCRNLTAGPAVRSFIERHKEWVITDETENRHQLQPSLEEVVTVLPHVDWVSFTQRHADVSEPVPSLKAPDALGITDEVFSRMRIDLARIALDTFHV
jgi:hypothetical protein